MSKKIIPQNKVIEDFISIHGNFYDYSKVEYVRNVDKVTIICPIHGEFEQTPKSHKKGAGCIRCRDNKLKKDRQFSTEYIVSKCKEIHGQFYSYSKVNYENKHTKVTIICPRHGEFECTPNNHLHGKGCPDCSYEKASRNLRFDVLKVIEDFKSVHGERYFYDFDKIDKEFKSGKSLLPVECKQHGTFYVSYDNHFRRQSNCPKCFHIGNNILGRLDNDLSCYVYNLIFTEKETGYKFEKVGITTKQNILDRFNSHSKKAFDIDINYYYETILSEAVEIEDMFLNELDENNLRYKVHTLKEKYPNTDNGWTECYPHNSFKPFKDWLDEKVLNR